MLIALSTLIVVGFGALNVLAYNHARSMMVFKESSDRTGQMEQMSRLQKLLVLIKGVRYPRPTATATPNDHGLPYQGHTIPIHDNITLGAWYVPGNANGPLIIMFHGHTADKSALLSEAAALHELGYALLMVDFRGSGESTESYTTIGYLEAEDVKAALHYAESEFSHSTHVLFGQSMGAAAILRALAVQNITPDAIVIEAIFDRMINTVRNRFEGMPVPAFLNAELLLFWGGQQQHFNAFSLNPEDYARAATCPVLVLHGTDDPRAKLSEARNVFDAVTAPKSFKEFPGTGHEAYVTKCPEEWKKSLRAFLQEHVD